MPTPTNAKKSKITKRTQLSHVDSASCLWRALQFAGLPIRVKYELGIGPGLPRGRERVNVVNIVNMKTQGQSKPARAVPAASSRRL